MGHAPLFGVTQMYALGGILCVGSEQHFWLDPQEVGSFGLHMSSAPAS